MSHSYLDEVGKAGEHAAEFLQLYQRLIRPTHWKVYLSLHGALMQIGDLITKVCVCLGQRKIFFSKKTKSNFFAIIASFQNVYLVSNFILYIFAYSSLFTICILGYYELIL